MELNEELGINKKFKETMHPGGEHGCVLNYMDDNLFNNVKFFTQNHS